MSVKSFLLLIVSLLSLHLWSCRKERFDTDSDTRLELETDSVLFDTVFTRNSPGSNRPQSATKVFRIYNNSRDWIKTKVRLGAGSASYFLLNVDGEQVRTETEFQIRPKDSLWIFVQVYINANNNNNPLVVMDSILFNTNGNEQKIVLRAWGQDAYYLTDSVLSTGTQTWNNDKPYVIYSSILVPENGKLIIPEGCRVHCWTDSKIYVEGTLEVNGTKEKPVVFQGARLEPFMRNEPGQWRGIHILKNSIGNVINYAEIKNTDVCIRIDSLSNDPPRPNLYLTNSIIRNASNIGILGVNASLYAYNNLIGNCGQAGFYGVIGGEYTFIHCTFADDNRIANRQVPFVLVRSYLPDGNGNYIMGNALEYRFVNCCIWGPLEDELFIDRDNRDPNPVAIVQNTLLRSKNAAFDAAGNVRNLDPDLENIAEFDLRPKAISRLINKGFPLGSPYLQDISGKTRDIQPDLGAYEF